MAKRKLKWQGEEVAAEHVTLKIYENKDKPLWWSNYEVCLASRDASIYALVPALKITYNERVFYISNHFGIGLRKLRKGGWPNHQHFGFDEIEEYKSCLERFDSYCERDFIDHERSRRIWQMTNFPKEFEASERLRKLIQKH